MVPASQQNWMPATYRERGVAVPFTSPVLAGARVRLLERKCDLIVPHPGGARGVYIFAMRSLTEFCAPTLHDLQLVERLQGVRAITPGSVRATARAAALQGLAGRDAAANAAAADAAEAAARLGVQSALLSCGPPSGAGLIADPAEGARFALMSLASRDGSTRENIKDNLDRLCAEIVASGLGVPCATDGSAQAGRCANLLRQLAEMEQQIRAWLGANGDMAAASQVADATQAIVAAGRKVLADAQAIIADTVRLFSDWAREPERLVERLTRPDWLLDGWENINLLWRLAEGEARADASAEAGVILPPFPPEGEGWLGGAPGMVAALRGRKSVGPMQRAGGRMPSEVVGLIARNERIRALSA